MLKMELFDWAINKQCYSVDGGRGICPLFCPHPGEFDSSFYLPSKAKKMPMPRGQPRGGGGELDAGGIN